MSDYFLVIASVIGIVATILNIILFFKVWSMTNNVTVRPSGSTNLIDGINDPVVLETAGASMQLVGSGSLNWYIY